MAQYEKKRLLKAVSERVKGIDFHPTEPWVLTTLYSGSVKIWSFETQDIVKTFDLTDVPVRAGRFVARKNWFVCGSDDFQIRVYNYNTSEKIASFEAHPDYIRAIAVHPQEPCILTASDDMTIKRWDWEKGWKCIKTYEGHSHYVMALAINPRDPQTFASACLDRTVKVWNINSDHANFTIEAHETKGVNYVEYYPLAGNPYLLTTSDDQTVKVWDYTTRTLIYTLGGPDSDDGHKSNVSFACYHPRLPLIISGSEDNTVKLWSSITYKCLSTTDYELQRAWCVSSSPQEQAVAIGFDEGAVALRIGRDIPTVSMNPQGWVASFSKDEILVRHVKEQKSIESSNGTVGIEKDKELSAYFDVEKSDSFSSFYPQSIAHAGNYFAVSGIGEYVIYYSRPQKDDYLKVLRSGSGSDFAWRTNSARITYATCTRSKNVDDVVTITKYSNSTGLGTTEKNLALIWGQRVDGLEGGPLLSVNVSARSGISVPEVRESRLYVYDWESGSPIDYVDGAAKHVYWSSSGEFLTVVGEEQSTIYRYAVENHRKNLKTQGDKLPVLIEVNDIDGNVRSGLWIEESFVYTDFSNRLSYTLGKRNQILAVFDKPKYLLGWLTDRVYLTDKDANIVSYGFSVKMIQFQNLVLRNDMEAAAPLLEQIISDPKTGDQRNKIAHFLKEEGHKEMALTVTTETNLRFELAIELKYLDIALEVAQETNIEETWKSVGDAALTAWNIALAENCFVKANDFSSLLLLYTSTGNAEGLQKLAIQAEEHAAYNVAFTCLWCVGDLDGCIDLLMRTGRAPEAVFFSKTYKPSRCRGVVEQWKAKLEQSGKPKISRMIAQPPEPNSSGNEDDMFPEWEDWLQAEQRETEQWEGSPQVDESKKNDAAVNDVKDVLLEETSHAEDTSS